MNQNDWSEQNRVNNNQKLNNNLQDLHKVSSFNVLVSLEESRLSYWGIGSTHAALNARIIVGQNGLEVLGTPMFDPFCSEALIQHFIPFQGQHVN
jgi:hypothetical protein